MDSDYFFSLTQKYVPEYNLLVERAKERGLKREQGYQIHHIIPKCIGGSNEANNLVKLSIRDHVEAHYLLALLYWRSKEPLLVNLSVAFSNIVNLDFLSLDEISKTSFEQRDEWADLVKEGHRKAAKALQSKKAAESRKKKLAEKYNGDCAGQLHTPEAKRKAVQTVKDRYGISPGLQKAHSLSREKYGGNAMGQCHTPEVRERCLRNSRAGIVKKYGYLGGQRNTPEARAKARETNLRKYGNANGKSREVIERQHAQQLILRKKKMAVVRSQEFLQWQNKDLFGKGKKYFHNYDAVNDFLSEKNISLEAYLRMLNQEQ